MVYSSPASDAPVLVTSDMYRFLFIEKCTSFKCCGNLVEDLPGDVEPVLDLPFWQVWVNPDLGYTDSACSEDICCTVTVWFGRLIEGLLGNVEPVLDLPLWQVQVNANLGCVDWACSESLGCTVVV